MFGNLARAVSRRQGCAVLDDIPTALHFEHGERKAESGDGNAVGPCGALVQYA